MTVTWRVKNLFKADAQKIADEIGDRKVTAEELVNMGRDESSELHKCFTWDDGIAAEKWRLQEARIILSGLVYKSDKEDDVPTRIYSLTTEKQTYQPTRHFVTQPDEYQNLLKRAYAELESFRKKYASLSELQLVFEAIDALK